MALRAKRYFSLMVRGTLPDADDITVGIRLARVVESMIRLPKERLFYKRLCQYCKGAPRSSGCTRVKELSFIFMLVLYHFHVQMTWLSHRLRTIKRRCKFYYFYSFITSYKDSTLWAMSRPQRACEEPQALVQEWPNYLVLECINRKGRLPERGKNYFMLICLRTCVRWTAIADKFKISFITFYTILSYSPLLRRSRNVIPRRPEKRKKRLEREKGKVGSNLFIRMVLGSMRAGTNYNRICSGLWFVDNELQAN